MLRVPYLHGPQETLLSHWLSQAAQGMVYPGHCPLTLVSCGTQPSVLPVLDHRVQSRTSESLINLARFEQYILDSSSGFSNWQSPVDGEDISFNTAKGIDITFKVVSQAFHIMGTHFIIAK